MDCTPIIMALRRRCPSLGGRVFGAAAYTRLGDRANPPTLPAAYAFLARETAETRQASETDYYSVVTATVAVVVLAGSGDERAQDAMDTLAATQAELIAALCGWSPLPGDPHGILAYEGCQVVEPGPAVVAMQYDFSLDYEIRAEDTFIPTLLAEGSAEGGGSPIGRLGTVDIGGLDPTDNAHGVDLIRHGTGAPDGIIEERLTISIQED